ncbi:MAG: hypothetical protein GY820_07275 [Gammaproteobacteria bacterium]|nr:hypothetical protein [Gammaproteobacteria bacterium]
MISAQADENTTVLPAEITSIIQNTYHGSEVAKKTDFGSYIYRLKKYFDIDPYLNTVLVSDLNRDNNLDYTVLLINKTKRFFGFYAFVSTENSYIPITLSTSSWPKSHDGSIWQLMWLKKSGDAGMSDEKYFNAPDKKYPFLNEYTVKDRIEYEAAVNKYVSLNTIEKTNMSFGDFDYDEIFYCKSAHYFDGNTIKTLEKCD